MSIGAALNKSITGLQATQAGLSVISTNIAAANMPGYVKRELSVTDGGDGTHAPGVQSVTIVRALDVAAQALMRRASTQDGAAATRHEKLQQLDVMIGGPGSGQGVDAAFRSFSNALTAIANDRGNLGAQIGLTAAARKLVTSIDAFSRSIQTLRSQAEAEIAAGVDEVNGLTAQLASVNDELMRTPNNNDLLDRRDRLIDQLATLGDFNYAIGESGRATVTTRGGIMLVGIGGAAKLSFDAKGELGPQDLYSPDPAARGTGTIMVNGLDLLAGNHFNSGKLGALIALRDHDLAASQRMIDDLAAGLALAARDPAAAPDKALFLNGTLAFTATSRDDPQRIGLSQRLTLNPAYANAPEQVETIAGVGTDNVFAMITTRLSSTNFETRPGITKDASGQQTASSFVTRILTDHASVMAAAADDADAAQVAKRNFTTLFAGESGVDINAQLADMIGLQNAYAANANVIRTIKDMLDVLNSI
jgi:flagellar hook-associated protein 1 FlgK